MAYFDNRPHISRGMGTAATLQPNIGPQGLPGPGAAAWAAAQAVTAGSVRQAPDGSWIKSTATRTTGASFDATEQTFWTAVLATTGTLEQTALSASYVGAVVMAGTGIDPTGVADSTAAIQTKITAAPDGSLIYFPKGTFKCGNLTIQNKVGVTVTGPGKINWTGTAAGSDSIGFQLVGTLTNVTIADMWLNGDAVVANGHAGVWCYSGQTITNLKIIRNRITNVVLGISVGADGSGLVDGLLIDGNDLDNIVGTAAGKGYGIHHGSTDALGQGVRIVNNVIRRAQRHSIYQAKGSGTLIHGNQCIDHRLTVASTAEIPAIAVGRGSYNIVTDNLIDGYADGGMTLFADTGTTSQHYTCRGNIFRGQANGVPALSIGGASPATTGIITDVLVDGNTFDTEGVAYQHIRIYSGKRLRFTGNLLTATGVPSTVTLVDLYGSGETGGATYNDDIVFALNRIYADGGTDARGIRLANEITTGTAKIEFLLNSITTVGAGVDIYGNVAVTNPNIRSFGQPHSLSGPTLLTTRLGPTAV